LQDLAVANRDSYTVSVLLGNGDGTFQAARHFQAGTRPHSVAIWDVNGDGLLDLAMANAGFTGDQGSVSVLLCNGDGTFQAHRNSSAGSNPHSVAVSDVTGNGLPGLAVANSAEYGGAPSVSVLLGNGDGAFQAARDFPTGTSSSAVAVGDVNGDGLP